MMPRQPSVPNLICVAIDPGFRGRFSKPLYQLLHLLFVEILHDLADILRVFSRSDKQGIVGLYHHQVIDTNCRDKLSFYVDEVAGRVQRETLVG